MNNGWDHDFNLQSVSDEVMKGIQDNMKMWDAEWQKRKEEIIKTRQEEVKILETEYKELMGDRQAISVSEPKYLKYIYCPCANGGNGGFFLVERDE